MTISIKHRSGGEILAAALQQHDFMADSYRALYPVPVKVRKHRNLEVGSDLKLAHMQAYAHKFVTARAKLQAEYL